MSSFLIVPTVFWSAYSDVEPATATAGGIFNALNSARTDYLTFSTDVETIDFTHSAALTIPTTISGSGAFWIKASDAIFDSIGLDTVYFQLWTGATIGTVAQKTLVTVYGDCTVSGDNVVTDTGIAKTDGYAHMIGVFDDQYTSVAWQIQPLTSAASNVAISLYEVMIGHTVSLPDGYVREERNVQKVSYGGKVGVKRFGDASWSGIFSTGTRKSFELVMEGLTETQSNVFRDVFRYCRGVFPVLVVEDSSDKTTWTKCRMTRRTCEENMNYFTNTIEFEEV